MRFYVFFLFLFLSFLKMGREHADLTASVKFVDIKNEKSPDHSGLLFDLLDSTM